MMVSPSTTPWGALKPLGAEWHQGSDHQNCNLRQGVFFWVATCPHSLWELQIDASHVLSALRNVLRDVYPSYIALVHHRRPCCIFNNAISVDSFAPRIIISSYMCGGDMTPNNIHWLLIMQINGVEIEGKDVATHGLCGSAYFCWRQMVCLLVNHRIRWGGGGMCCNGGISELVWDYLNQQTICISADIAFVQSRHVEG